MLKPVLLYICLNDGSDTRINKEIRTLAEQYAIHYVGIGRSPERSFVAQYCERFELIGGHHKDVGPLIRYWLRVVSLLLKGQFQAVHLINEQLVLLFYPFLYRHRRKVVVDIFDSIFLRKNGRYRGLMRFVYGLPKVVLVTDENRKGLLPQWVQQKTLVVENFPHLLKESTRKVITNGNLVIFYNGSMSRSRGTDLLGHLLELSLDVRVKMAGWVYDEPTRLLTQHPQVDFLGVVHQQESLRIAAGCDYILSLYEPSNENNINASPNKIYDAIQVGTPVIINAEVKVSQFVEENGIGYVMKSFYETDYAGLLIGLKQAKNNYTFPEELRHRYTWEAVEGKLLEAHRQ